MMRLEEQYLLMIRDYEQGIYEPTLYGIDNKNRKDKTGYSIAVSGLDDMSKSHERMLKAEAHYWKKFKNDNPELWSAQLARLKHTRGTIFTDRLLKDWQQ